VITLPPRRKRKRTRTILAAAVSAATLGVGLVAYAGAPAASAATRTGIAAAPRASAQAAAKIQALTKVGLNVLMSQFSPGDGLVNDTHWRQAVAVSAVEAYRQTTKDNSYDIVFDEPFANTPVAGAFENDKDDDTAWWGLAALQAYQITHQSYDLTIATGTADYIDEDWSNACGNGGVWWNRSPEQAKNSIANELFLELTAWLSVTYDSIPGDASLATKYLNEAEAEWTWFSDSGLISNGKPIPDGKNPKTGKETYVANNPQYLVRDGLLENTYADKACGESIATDLFTYNQGVILAGLAELYQAALGDPGDTKYRAQAPGYLTEAKNIADAVLNAGNTFTVPVKPTGKPAYKITTSFVVKGGVLTEPTCQPAAPCGTGDEGAFKGIFVRDLRTLDNLLATLPPDNQCTATYNGKKYSHCTSMYNDFLTTQAMSIASKDVAVTHGLPAPPWVWFTYHWFGMFWGGPSSPHAVVTHVSGLEALVAALRLPTAPAS
jgi:predicted alpha-1,6-mannanase (GH76 family)